MTLEARSVTSRFLGLGIGLFAFAAAMIGSAGPALRAQPPAASKTPAKSNSPAVVTNSTQVKDLAQLQNELETENARTALEQAQLLVEIRRAELEDAESEHTLRKRYASQMEKALARGAFKQEQIDNSNRELVRARTNAAAKQAQLKQAIAAVRNAQVRLQTLPEILRRIRTRGNPAPDEALKSASREALIERIQFLEAQVAELRLLLRQ